MTMVDQDGRVKKSGPATLPKTPAKIDILEVQEEAIVETPYLLPRVPPDEEACSDHPGHDAALSNHT